MAVYFSNLKSYLLISYVSPPRLGIFTEAIVSASAALTVPRARARARACEIPILSALFSFSSFFSPRPLPPWPSPAPFTLCLRHARASFFFNRTRPMRGKLRGTNDRSILTSPSAMTAGRRRAITLTSAPIHLTVRY